MKFIESSLTHILISALIVLIGAYLKIQGYGTTVLLIGLILEFLAIMGFIFRHYRKKLSTP